MENLMVIRVEVIAPENPLDANTSSKNIAYVDFNICKCPKISSVLIWPVAISKNTLCWFRTIGHIQKLPSPIKPMPYSLTVFALSLSPHFAISRSLFLCSLPMIHLYWFHIKSASCCIIVIIVWLTINVWGRTSCFTYPSNTIIRPM